MIAVLLLLVFVAPFIGYAFKRNYAIGNMIHTVIAVVLSIALIVLVKFIKTKCTKINNFINSKQGFRLIIIIGTAILLCLEVFIVCGGWFIVGWDTRNVIFPDMQIDNDYMSMYPNQLFLAGIFRSIYLCINDFNTYYFTLVLISAVLTCLCVILIVFISKKLTNNFCAIATFLLAAIFIGLSPWIMVPYSDNFAMFCTTFCLFTYVCIKPKPLKWGLIFFIGLLGVAIKPTVIFVIISVVIVELILLFIKKKETSTKNVVLSIATIVISIIVSSGIVNTVSNYGVSINDEDSFTHTHFLMMGINRENDGAWNIDDVNFSRSFFDVKSREEANIKEWETRLFTYGPIEISRIFIYKTMTNYGDGAFAWEAERPWCIENRGTNPLVWAFYGIDPADNLNDNNNYFAYVWQVMWIMIIIGNIAMLFNKKQKPAEYVMCFSMLAISAFLTIFEPDPRYLMLYVPFMVIIAPWGFKHGVLYFDKFQNLRTKNS
ncbi:MAG: hypothetical protein Q4E88_04250 [Coriobacteriia bacterium]|nr:hypothetical protein [Coriobacteriia bacterium]